MHGIKLFSFFVFAISNNTCSRARLTPPRRPRLRRSASGHHERGEAAASAQPKEIYRPEEMAKLLTVAERDVRVTLGLKVFSGIRTEELVRLRWVLINENIGHVNVTEAV